MRESFPLVTIVALSYNHEKFVIKTLDSIKNQTYQNIQLIIIDNCSKDNTISLIHDWIKNNQIDNVFFIPNNENLGVCSALNVALTHANGEFFQFISCDDVLAENKIELQVSIFRNLPLTVAFIYGNFDYIDENGSILNEMNRFVKLGWYNQYDLPVGRIGSELINNYFLCAPTLLYRTQCIRDIGGYDVDIPFEDFQMNIRLLEKYSCQGLYDILCQYRILTNSFYNSFSESKVENNYLHTMKYIYGKSYQQNWIILLRYVSFKDNLISRFLKKSIFTLLYLVSKEYKKDYGIK